MFNKNNIDKILKQNKKKRIKELSDDLDNIVFLDFDVDSGYRHAHAQRKHHHGQSL